jgi:predicted secreted protein
MQRYDGPHVIAPVRHDLTAKPGTNPAAVGGIGDATFRVRGVAPGKQPVVIEYKRAFEAAAAKTIRFDVVVL